MISFVTLGNKIISNYGYTASIYSTPKLLLISNSVVSPGVNTISLKKNDTMSATITTIKVVSTINSSNSFTISNWTTLSDIYTFSVNLTAGSYQVLALTAYGYCLVNSTISVTLPSGSSITSKITSFGGDTVTISGQYLSPSSYISVNGFNGSIINYSPSSITYSVPAIDFPKAQAAFIKSRNRKILPS